LRPLSWLALGFIAFSLPVAAKTERQFLHGHVPAAVSRLKALGDLDAAANMQVLIGLPLRNQQALTNLLRDLYNPASPSYHKYLTPAQFAEQFSPTAGDYQSVIAFAKGSGLAISRAVGNRTMLAATGSAAEIEKAFHVHLRRYQHPAESRAFFAPDTEPSLDLATPILDITGLDNFVLPHPLSHIKAARSHARPMSGSSPAGLYWGNDFRAAYVPGTSLTGAGQTVGLFELDDYAASDITTYESNAGLPNVPVSRILLDGASAGAGVSEQVEVPLDIEMAIAMAPGLAGVLVYEGPNVNSIISPNMVLNCMATNDAAMQLSCSWGFSINASTVQTFQQFGAQGQSFFLASGDSGAFTGAAQPPSDDPYATVVGGTTLNTTGPGGSWASEAVWNWFSSGEGTNGSTGGISTAYTIPSWQAPVSMAQNQGSSAMRNLPDVALAADQIFVVGQNGGHYNVGGTSCAAPLWAGFAALVNQQGAMNARPPAGFLNPALYALGLGSLYGSAFHDITSGNNTNFTVNNRYFAAPGYDLCTGWGTPNGTNMINALAPPATTPIVTAAAALAAESCLPGNGAIDPGETVTLNLTLTNLSPAATTNLVATLQASGAVLSPSGSQAFGALRQGQPAATAPFTFTADGLCGETISLAWRLQDGERNLGIVTLNYALGTAVSGATLAENFDSTTAPGLPNGWTAAATGSQANWITTGAAADTLPNAAFAQDAANPGLACLYSPVFPVISTNAQLTFRQNHNLEFSTTRSFGQSITRYFDGGVLDIAIGSGGFNDIISAGGSFVTGGYNGTLYTGSGNPRAGGGAWGGNSSGWITTTINLPEAAAGQQVQLRWGCATDQGNSGAVTGWYVDSIMLKDVYYTCCGDSANLSLAQTVAPSPLAPGQDATYTIIVTNAGPDLAAGVVVADTLPPQAAFVSASAGGVYDGVAVTWPAGVIASGGVNTMTVTVLAATPGAITNTVAVSAITPSSQTGGNTAISVAVVGGAAEIIPGSVTFASGSGLSLSVNSTAGLQYSLEYKNSLTDSTWTPLPASTVAGNGGVITLQDNSPAQAQRFYRITAN
jgi:uncharacterized repeat protein (TIGR01451 family)